MSAEYSAGVYSRDRDKLRKIQKEVLKQATDIQEFSIKPKPHKSFGRIILEMMKK